MSRESIYQSRAAKFGERESEFQELSNRYCYYRLYSFLAGLIPILYALLAADEPVLMLILVLVGLACFLVFAVLVFKHRGIDQQIKRYRLLKELNEQAVCRLKRDWQGIPVPRAQEALETLPMSQDLNLFGAGSLFHLLSTQRTPQGRVTLAKWLTDPADTKEAIDRQKSVAAISPDLDFRQEMAATGESLSVDEAVIVPEFMEREYWLGSRKGLLRYLPFAPWISLLSLFFTFFILHIPIILIVIVFHFFLISRNHRAIEKTLTGLAGEDRKIWAYIEVFDVLRRCPAKTGRLRDLMPKVEEAHAPITSLNHIATMASARGSVIHPLLNAIALFDLRTVRALEGWQRAYQAKVPGWFKALGEIEALCSLAALAYDEPDWAIPTFSKGGSAIRANALGHPLIAGAKRVTNDVSVGPEGRFLLITGSNMAGKSTLMRSIGLNVVLAQAGATACARELATPPLTMATSMGVQDSLLDGLSHFMAELQRIKEIVNLTREEHKEGRTVLFLLDEILQGTNSVERREIVKRVMANLTENKGIGAITTHDLALADSSELVKNADLIHFREHFERKQGATPTMTFDYKIHPGIATTTNALKILEVIEMRV